MGKKKEEEVFLKLQNQHEVYEKNRQFYLQSKREFNQTQNQANYMTNLDLLTAETDGTKTQHKRNRQSSQGQKNKKIQYLSQNNAKLGFEVVGLQSELEEKIEMLNQISKENEELKQRLSSTKDEQKIFSMIQKLKKQNEDLIQENCNLKQKFFVHLVELNLCLNSSF